MSYTTNRYRRKGGARVMTKALAKRPPVGDVISDIEGLLAAGGTLAEDPYTSEMVCHFQQLAQIHNSQPPQSCAQVPYGTPSPAGLGQYILPMRALVYLQENPWAYALVLGVVFGIPIYIGYEMGYTDGKKRSSS